MDLDEGKAKKEIIRQLKILHEKSHYTTRLAEYANYILKGEIQKEKNFFEWSINTRLSNCEKKAFKNFLEYIEKISDELNDGLNICKIIKAYTEEDLLRKFSS